MPLIEMMWWFHFHVEQKKSENPKQKTGFEAAAVDWQYKKKTGGLSNKKKPVGEKTIQQRKLEIEERRVNKK